MGWRMGAPLRATHTRQRPAAHTRARLPPRRSPDHVGCCSILQALNVRETAMKFLRSDNEEVRQQALLACSKILVAKWQFVASGSSATAGAATPTPTGGAGTAAAGKR